MRSHGVIPPCVGFAIYWFHTEIDESLKLVVPMMAFTHTAVPAAMSASDRKEKDTGEKGE